MRPSELFGVAVRTIGLLIVLPSLGSVAFALLGLVMGGPAEIIGHLWWSIPALLVGLWFLRGADGLVAFAYPEESPTRPIYAYGKRIPPTSPTGPDVAARGNAPAPDPPTIDSP